MITARGAGQAAIGAASWLRTRGRYHEGGATVRLPQRRPARREAVGAVLVVEAVRAAERAAGGGGRRVGEMHLRGDAGRCGEMRGDEGRCAAAEQSTRAAAAQPPPPASRSNGSREMQGR